MDNGNNTPPSTTSPNTVVVQNVVTTMTTIAANPTTASTTTVAGTLVAGGGGDGANAANTPRLIQLKVPVTSSAATMAATPSPPRPPTPHSSITPNSTSAPSPQSHPTTIAQAPTATSNIPRICNLGPLIYLQATGVKGGTPVNSSVATGGNTATTTPVQFTMPQIIAGNPQIIHTNNSQSNQAFAYLGTLIKQGVKGKEATSQKVLLTPMPNNKPPQIASVILPGNEPQTHGNKGPMASLILQPGANVQGKMTGLILGSPNSNSPVNKTSLLLPAPPGGAPGKKITNINIPVTGKTSVPNIIRQSSSVAGGKTFILPQGGNTPGLIIPASNAVGKPGANQVTGLILPSTSSSGLIIPPSSTSGSAPLTNLIITTQPTSSHQSSSPQMASLIISNPSSTTGSSSTTTGIIVPAASGVTSHGSTSGTTVSSTTSVTNAAGAKMAGIFLPVSMEVQGKNNVTHHLTISNGKIHSGEQGIAVPALKPVAGYGLPALQPISKEVGSIPAATIIAKPGRSVLKKNIEVTIAAVADNQDKTKKDEGKDDDPAVVVKDKPGVVDLSCDKEPEAEVRQEIKTEVGEKRTGAEGEVDEGKDAKEVTDYDLNKENTLPNVVKDEDVKDDVIKSELTISPTPEEFDPMKVLEWDAKGVGKLPGSDLKFRLNEFGMMIVHDENDTKSAEIDNTSSIPTSEKKEEKKPHKESIKASKDSDEIYCCDGCGCYGLSTEFLDTLYCSVACRKFMQSKSSPVGGANKRRQLSTDDDKLRDLKMRKKRRKMKIMEVKRRANEAAAALDASAERGESRKEIDWLKEFVVLKARKEAAAMGGGGGGSQEAAKVGETTRTSQDEAPSDVDVSVSRSGTASPTLTDADDLSSQTDKKVSWLSKSGEFLWNVYLNHHKAKAAHIKLFKDPFPYQKNGFKVGMKLEGIDPEHQSYICVLTVAEVRGFRIRLHFDGYPENHDFWTNADSPDIFQPGWCEKNSHELHRPRGYSKENFNWNLYLKQCKAQAAPKNLFSSRHANPVTPNQFRVGMKVEAVDRHNSNLICVATVADIIDNRMLIHFDSWGDVYDYWVDPSSPYIHPVGWCNENNHELTPPNNYKSVTSFSWDAYLKETKSVAAPARAFKMRPPSGFRAGMRLEAVDRRAPHLVRVATVAAVNQHQIRITFDGFPDAFGYWVDDDSPDIHPVGWAQKTLHPLEPPPPPSGSNDDKPVECTTPGCRGDGNTRGAMLTSHDSPACCPYSPHFLNKDPILPDRFTIKHDFYELPPETSTKSKSSRESRESSVTTDGNKGSYDGDSGDEINGRRSVTSNEDDYRGSRTRNSNYIVKEERRGRKRKTEKLDSSDVGLELKKLRKDLIESVLKPGYHVDNESACWTKHSATFGLKASDVHDNPINWTPKQVASFLSSIYPSKCKVFIDQEIDGEALLMLSQSDLTNHLGFKLGPAIKIYNMISILRQKVF